MSIDSKFAINHYLRSNGMASLDEAGPLVAQFAYLVRDHTHFRSLLNACEPAERGHMYAAMAPNLRFEAKPLATYMIEMAQDAERRQLPTIGEDGNFKPFKVPELTSAPGSDEAIATAAVADAVAKQRLLVVCAVCTREDVFRGLSKEDAVKEARAAGWRHAQKHDGDLSQPVEVCPRCVKARAPRIRAA